MDTGVGGYVKLRAGLNLGEKGGKGEEKDEDHYGKDPYRLKLYNTFDIFKLLEARFSPPPHILLHAPKHDKS